MNMAAFLKKQQDKWADAVERAGSGGAQYPDGVFLLQLTGAELTESSGGKAQIHWSWTFAGGEFDGEQKHDYDGLENDDSFYYLAIKLARFGYDPSEIVITKLEETLDDLVDRAVFARCKLMTKKDSDFQNVRILKVFPDGYNPATEDDDEAPAPKSKPSTGKTPPPAKKAPAKTEDDEQEEPPAKKGPGRPPKAGAKAPAKTKEPEPEPEPEQPEETEETTEGSEDGEGDEVELTVGMKVQFERNGKTLIGSVTAIDDEAETAKVKAGVKTYTLGFDEMEVPEVDE